MNCGPEKKCCCGKGSFFSGLVWWCKLLVAVIAIPSIAFVVIAATKADGFLQALLFMLTCWVCTFIGMNLMKSSNKNKPD